MAFAFDYTRFDVYAKDCPKRLVDWEVDPPGPIATSGVITNPNYNENPVIRLVQQFQAAGFHNVCGVVDAPDLSK